MDGERSLRGGVFEKQKDSVVLGTYESSAFILSLRDPDEFSSVHSFGCHRVPHVGVYGKDYTISLPMVLLSLPATQRTIQKLPPDLLGALDLDHLLTPTQPSQQPQPPQLTIPSFGDETKTTTQELKENILTFQRVYAHTGLSPERIVAKALVDCVIHSAQKRVAPPIFTFGAGLENSVGHSPSAQQIQTCLCVNNSSGIDVSRMEWRETKRASSGRLRGVKGSTLKSYSGISMESEGYVSASSDCSDLSKTERRKVSFLVGEERAFTNMDTVEEIMEEEEEELRIVAKKLVMKALHMACKEVESLYRRSSIEYLIASTKRMKIEESPSPPPVLFNIVEEDQDGADVCDGRRPNPFSDLRPSSSERSPTPEHLLLRRLGKKRGRSGSHEVSALREFVETSRRSKVVRKMINFKDRIMGGIQQFSAGSVKSPNEDSSSQSGDEGMSFTSLVSNLSRMTIGDPPQESDTESEPATNADESFTVLNAITVSEDPLAGLRDEVNTSDTGKRFHFQEPNHQRSNHLGATTLYPIVNSTHATPTTSPLAVQSLSSSSPLMKGTSPAIAQSSIVPDMDVFVVIHSHPTPGECQKFLCNNTNEVNLMYHCWMYPNTPFDQSLTITGKLEMGVFEPSYVEPVHLDLQDAGVPFYYLEERTVCIHHCCFSPENAQLQLTQVPDHTPTVHSFFSAARRGSRRVATFHVIPSSQRSEQRVRACIQNCSNIGQLLTRLTAAFPDVGQTVLNLVATQ